MRDNPRYEWLKGQLAELGARPMTIKPVRVPHDSYLGNFPNLKGTVFK